MPKTESRLGGFLSRVIRANLEKIIHSRGLRAAGGLRGAYFQIGNGLKKECRSFTICDVVFDQKAGFVLEETGDNWRLREFFKKLSESSGDASPSNHVLQLAVDVCYEWKSCFLDFRITLHAAEREFTVCDNRKLVAGVEDIKKTLDWLFLNAFPSPRGSAILIRSRFPHSPDALKSAAQSLALELRCLDGSGISSATHESGRAIAVSIPLVWEDYGSIAESFEKAGASPRISAEVERMEIRSYAAVLKKMMGDMANLLPFPDDPAWDRNWRKDLERNLPEAWRKLRANETAVMSFFGIEPEKFRNEMEKKCREWDTRGLSHYFAKSLRVSVSVYWDGNDDDCGIKCEIWLVAHDEDDVWMTCDSLRLSLVCDSVPESDAEFASFLNSAIGNIFPEIRLSQLPG